MCYLPLCKSPPITAAVRFGRHFNDALLRISKSILPLAATLNVLVISDNNGLSRPLWAVKQRNARRNVLTDKSSVSSKWIAQVEMDKCRFFLYNHPSRRGDPQNLC